MGQDFGENRIHRLLVVCDYLFYCAVVGLHTVTSFKCDLILERKGFFWPLWILATIILKATVFTVIFGSGWADLLLVPVPFDVPIAYSADQIVVLSGQ